MSALLQLSRVSRCGDIRYVQGKIDQGGFWVGGASVKGKGGEIERRKRKSKEEEWQDQLDVKPDFQSYKREKTIGTHRPTKR